MKDRTVEILAPAGSYESMVAAVNAGADAVYIGGSRFGARAYANNLDEEKMLQAIDFMHLHGKKIYLTVNTLVKEKELGDLYGYLKPYYEAGVDAVLVQDMGALIYIHEHFPDLPLHISTQMTVTASYSAGDLKKIGAVRVVPARELSLSEIQQIHTDTGLEVETFVHGALCYCYSGQCLFSSLIGGRSGNRGRCAQPCRLPFCALQDGNVINKKNEKYLLSLKDLCTLDLIPDLLEAGVCSLKIEGRMKSPRYTAGVVSIYRKYVDRYLQQGRSMYTVEKKDREALLSLFDRGGQTQGYYRTHNGRDMVVLKEKPDFREVDQGLLDRLDADYVNAVKKIPVNGSAFFSVEQEGYFSISDDEGHMVTVNCGRAEEAKSAPMNEERVRKQLSKTGDSPFELKKLDVRCEGKLFLPVQSLNRLRRDALAQFYEERLLPYRRNHSIPPNADECQKLMKSAKIYDKQLDSQKEAEFTVLVTTRDQLNIVLDRLEEYRKKTCRVFGVYLACESFDAGDWKKTVALCHEKSLRCYLMLPRIFRKEAQAYLKQNLEKLSEAGFDALGVASMEEPGFLRENHIETSLYFDHGMYVWNHLAKKAMIDYGASRVTLPVELTKGELAESGVRGEMIIYGYLPMMVSAQCIRKTTLGCSKKTELLWLKDRKDMSFPVVNQCRFCYNTIYNCAPLSLHGLAYSVKDLNPSSLRMNFTIEGKKETGEILDAFFSEYCLNQNVREPETLTSKFTRGHFKRGVE